MASKLCHTALIPGHIHPTSVLGTGNSVFQVQLPCSSSASASRSGVTPKPGLSFQGLLTLEPTKAMFLFLSYDPSAVENQFIDYLDKKASNYACVIFSVILHAFRRRGIDLVYKQMKQRKRYLFYLL